MIMTAYDLGAKPEPSEIVSQAASVKRVKCAYAPVVKGNNQPDPNSRKRKCLRAGLGQNAVSTYRYRNPETEMTDDEIIQHLLSLRSKKSMTQMAREAGINPSTVSYRMLRGMSLDEALGKPVEAKYGRQV